MMTAEQARVLFEKIKTENPERWGAGVQTVVVSILEELEVQAKTIASLVDRVSKLNNAVVKLVQGLRGGAAPKPEGEAAPNGNGEPVGRPGKAPSAAPAGATARVGSDGLPLTGDQIVAENQMDEAIAAAEAEKRA